MIFSVSKIFSKAEWKWVVGELGLSSQQAQITQHLLEGLGDKQIAAVMGISTHTVRTHLERIFAKLNVHDRNELLVGVFRQFRSGCPSDCPQMYRQ